jgi:hypothetical protein
MFQPDYIMLNKNLLAHVPCTLPLITTPVLSKPTTDSTS